MSFLDKLYDLLNSFIYNLLKQIFSELTYQFNCSFAFTKKEKEFSN